MPHGRFLWNVCGRVLARPLSDECSTNLTRALIAKPNAIAPLGRLLLKRRYSIEQELLVHMKSVVDSLLELLIFIALVGIESSRLHNP